ncbi:MAG: [acyl-carrier-protein] S-malonyltransferase [Gammaproteobacteria bacterium]|jgi:[acyl-carrier-protein] S-malonyltransferase|nr:[acyl-carrier-protein] S-malonyltransferase [Gammaproteobacteria bacterium]
MSLAFVFPGQASQSVGMMAALATISPLITATFAQASAVLGYDLWQRCQEGPAELLNSTECTQPAMLTAGVATYRLWRDRGGAVPKMMAGHSLGEFSALVAADYLDFNDAVDLVRYRGELMQAAVPSGLGAIAAILGLEDADVEAACLEASQGETVEAVNFNAPGQVVIAGDAGAVARAIEAATAKGARRAMMLPMSVPAHSSLMRPAAEKLRIRLDRTPVAGRSATQVYGVNCQPHTNANDIRAGLVKQLSTPVYWSATVRTMISAGATRIVECGPGKILTALNRRIDKNRELKMLALEDPQSLDDALAAVA